MHAAPEMDRAIISSDKLSQIQGREESSSDSDAHLDKEPTFDPSEEPPSAEPKRSGEYIILLINLYA